MKATSFESLFSAIIDAIKKNKYEGFFYSRKKPFLYAELPSEQSDMKMKKNEEITFEEFESKGDGNCGFYVLGLSRENTVEILASQAEDEKTRQYLSSEIINELKSNGLIDAQTERSKALYQAYQALQKKQAEFEQKANDIVKRKCPQLDRMGLGNLISFLSEKALSDSDEEYEELFKEATQLVIQSKEIERDIKTYCVSKEMYLSYVTNSLGKTGWLGYQSALLMAKSKRFNLYIWRKVSLSSTKLELIDKHCKPDLAATYHILHTNGFTHFNLLALTGKAESLSDSQFESEEKLKMEPFEWDDSTLSEVRDYINTGYSIQEIIIKMADTGIGAKDIEKMVVAKKLPQPKREVLDSLEDKALLAQMEEVINSIKFMIRQKKFRLEDIDAVNVMVERMALPDEKQLEKTIIFNELERLRSAHKNYTEQFLLNIIDSYEEEEKNGAFKSLFQLLYQINPGQKYSKNEVKQKFYKLSFRFHYDKIKTKKYSFSEEFKKLYDHVFGIISDLRNKLNGPLDKLVDIEYCIKAGNDFFQEMCEEKDASLRMIFFERSYNFYVDARRKADEEKNVAVQIEVRQTLANLLLERAKNFDASLILDAQLYALASMKLAYELLSGREQRTALAKSKVILEKINSKGKEKKDETKTTHPTKNKSESGVLVTIEAKHSLITSQEREGTLVTYRTPQTSQELRVVCSEEIPRSFFSLVISSNKQLVEYTLSKRSLTSYSKLSHFHRAGGALLRAEGMVTGVLVGGSQLYEAVLILLTASASAGPAAPLLWGTLGLAAGITLATVGHKTWNKGVAMGERVKEAKIIARNIEQAMEFYEKERFDQFLNVLGTNIAWPDVYVLTTLPNKEDLENRFLESFLFIDMQPLKLFYVKKKKGSILLNKIEIKNIEPIIKLFKKTPIGNILEPLHKLIAPQQVLEFYEQITSNDGQRHANFDPAQEIKLLTLDYNKSWIVNTESFIDTLIKYGFRPDGIAHLLNLIVQVLLSGRLQLEVMNENIFVAAENILGQIIDDKDKQLNKHALAIDKQVEKDDKQGSTNLLHQIFLGPGLYIKNAKSYFYHYYYGAETLQDSKKLSIVNRLVIETNIARINLALLLLTKVGIFDSAISESDAKKKLANIEKAVELIKTVGDTMKNIALEDKAETVQNRLDIIKDFMEIFGYKIHSDQESQEVSPTTLDPKAAKIQRFHNIRKIQLSSSEASCIILPVHQSKNSMLDALNRSLSAEGHDLIITRDSLSIKMMEQLRTDRHLKKLLKDSFKAHEQKDYIHLFQSIEIIEELSSPKYLPLIAHLWQCEIQVYKIAHDTSSVLTLCETIRPYLKHHSMTIRIAQLALDLENKEYHFSGLEISSNNQILIVNRKLSQAKEPDEILDLYRQRGELYRSLAESSAKYHDTLASRKYWELCLQDYEKIAENKLMLLSISQYYVIGSIILSRFELALKILDLISGEIKPETKGNYYYQRALVLLKKKDPSKAERALKEAETFYKTYDQLTEEKQRQLFLKKNWIAHLKKRLNSPGYFIAEHKKNKDFISLETKSESKESFNILSIDGGGIRGILPAVILTELENRIGRSLASTFQLIAGTSTGGIISAGLATPDKTGVKPKYRALDLLELYTEKGKSIFSQRRSWISNLWNPLYKIEPLKNLLIEYFGVVTLSQAVTDLLIAAVDSRKQYQTFFFDSTKAKSGEQKNYPLWQVTRATSAAPTYFEPFCLDSHHFVDGGITTNNPAHSAYSHAIELGHKPRDIFLLSLGTGRFLPDPLHPNKYSGQLFWAKNLHKIALWAQEEDTHKHLLESFKAGLFGNYQRLQPDLPEVVPLDGVSDQQIAQLIETAEEFIEQDDASDNSQLHTIVRHFGA